MDVNEEINEMFQPFTQTPEDLMNQWLLVASVLVDHTRMLYNQPGMDVETYNKIAKIVDPFAIELERLTNELL